MGTSVITVIEYNYDAETKDWVPVRKTVTTSEDKKPYYYTINSTTGTTTTTKGYPKTEKEWADFVATQIKKVVDKSQEWL